MKKPKPPKSFEEVEAYIREKRLNVNPKIFWDYFDVSGWYDGTGNPVLNWKQKAITWHGRDKKTIAAYLTKKLSKQEKERSIQRLRDDYQAHLENKSTEALLDLKKDGGQLSKVCGWLIDEILTERAKK
jgi:hypothetical protein